MLKRFNGILSSKILHWDGVSGIFSLGKAINFYNFIIVEGVSLFLQCPIQTAAYISGFVPAGKTNWKQTGVAR